MIFYNLDFFYFIDFNIHIKCLIYLMNSTRNKYNMKSIFLLNQELFRKLCNFSSFRYVIRNQIDAFACNSPENEFMRWFCNYYVFYDRVALFFADNFSTECRITMKFLHNFFSNSEVILRSHIMFINTSRKEFTLVNNASPSHDVASEHLIYYKMVANVY